MNSQIDSTSRQDKSSLSPLRLLAGPLLVVMVAVLSGCAESVNLVETVVREPVGFWYGLLHGLILPFSFVISLFDPDVAVYAVYNTGSWYDFGFLLGILISIGGSGKAS